VLGDKKDTTGELHIRSRFARSLEGYWRGVFAIQVFALVTYATLVFAPAFAGCGSSDEAELTREPGEIAFELEPASVGGVSDSTRQPPRRPGARWNPVANAVAT
jgi:hypothetical protein